MGLWKVFFCVAVSSVIHVSSIDVRITSNSDKIVLGSNITFTATILQYPEGEEVKFTFHDNAQKEHKKSFEIASNVSEYIVNYPKDSYEPGAYTMQVDLKRNYFGTWIRVASSSTTFQLTDTLNGNLTLSQNGVDRPNSFVAVNKTVHHYIALPENELEFLKQNSSTITTYWFVDCQLVGPTFDFALDTTYTDTMGEHHIEAILLANNDPLPPTTTTTTPPPTTTTVTTTSTSTTTKEQTTSKPTTLPTTSVPNVTEPLTVKELTNATSNKTRAKRDLKGQVSKCNNSVPIGDHYTYGRYETVVNVREPINTVNITGLNWLQHGDLLNLEVKYTGSPPFDYCIMYKLGQYNVTGNETCTTKARTVSNTFPLVHYFSDCDQHTVIVVIENDIGKSVSRATINIYKTSVHAQLSVIVVPVFFCLVAVILVVFGIAYYQHRSRHTVEVADFDFGQAHPDYKTFRERLRDSFRNAFNFGNHDDQDPLTSNSRYDSMT